jgi:hypothetical protein
MKMTHRERRRENFRADEGLLASQALIFCMVLHTGLLFERFTVGILPIITDILLGFYSSPYCLIPAGDIRDISFKRGTTFLFQVIFPLPVLIFSPHSALYS